jgi:hypothetical protein
MTDDHGTHCERKCTSNRATAIAHNVHVITTSDCLANVAFLLVNVPEAK